jgi:hypothetical protein
MAATLYQRLPLAARELGYRLGLGDIQLSEPCSGYLNMCVCDRCLEADERAADRGQLRLGRREIARLRQDTALLELNSEKAAA